MIVLVDKFRNEIATGTWQMYDAADDEAAIIAKYRKRYGVDPQHIYRCVRPTHTMTVAGPVPVKKESK